MLIAIKPLFFSEMLRIGVNDVLTLYALLANSQEGVNSTGV